MNKLLISLLLLVSTVTSSCTNISRIEKRSLKNQESITDLRNILAKQTVTMDQLKFDNMRLTGDLEELTHQINGKGLKLREKISNISSEPEVFSDTLALELIVEEEKKLATRSSVPEKEYLAALKSLRQGQVNRALDSFKKFESKYYGHFLADNAKFWVAVCLEATGKNDSAIVTYSELVQDHPTEERSDDALYRLANVFDKMGEHVNAKITFDKLIRDYEDSPYIESATMKLKEYSLE